MNVVLGSPEMSKVMLLLQNTHGSSGAAGGIAILSELLGCVLAATVMLITRTVTVLNMTTLPVSLANQVDWSQRRRDVQWRQGKNRQQVSHVCSMHASMPACMHAAVGSLLAAKSRICNKLLCCTY